MNNSFFNVYGDQTRADSYAKLEFPGTYYLAYRDLPEIISKFVCQGEALDFGCGTGRSTRFLSNLGFQTVGIDVSEQMIEKAIQLDSEARYIVVDDGNFNRLNGKKFDLALSVFTFDNIPTKEQKINCLLELRKSLKPNGRLIMLVSSPEIYTHQWASFSTSEFPENHKAVSGDKVRIRMLDVEDARPVEDVLWTDSSYRELFEVTELECLDSFQPLGRESEPFQWVTETRISPWCIYVLEKNREQ